MEGSFAASKKYENNLDIQFKKERGIYYTPYTVVEYILDNTLANHDIVKDPWPRVLDLCCGCGNFLIKAYDILYDKFYQNIDELNQKYGQDFISKETISSYILTKCIFGVDTDREALDVLKKQFIKIHREHCEDKSLEEVNVFCGDSLKIDFKDVFCVDKFDYIVGNPPYIGQKLLDNNYKKFLYREYKDVYKDKGDLYFCFYKRILDLLKQDGIAGIITPRYFMQSPSGKYLRRYLVENCKINIIVDFLGANIFNNLGIASCILVYEHRNACEVVDKYTDLYKIIDENINIKKIENLKEYLEQDNFEKLKIDFNSIEDTWLMVNQEGFEFYNKIQSNSQFFLEEICESFQGIITGCDKAFVVREGDENVDKIDRKLLKNWIKNKDVGKYIINNSQYKLIYSNDIDNENDYKFVVETFLSPYKQKLMNRRECIKNTRKWYELQWGRDKHLFEQKKIMYPYKSKNNRFAIDFDNSYVSADVYSFYIKDEYKEEFSYEYLVGILNSDVYDKYFKIIGKEMGKKIFDYYPNKVMKLKIFKDENYTEIENLSKEIISLSKKLMHTVNKIEEISVENLTKSENQDEFNRFSGGKTNVNVQDKKISLLKEKNYLENKVNFLENIISRKIKNSLNLD